MPGDIIKNLFRLTLMLVGGFVLVVGIVTFFERRADQSAEIQQYRAPSLDRRM